MISGKEITRFTTKKGNNVLVRYPTIQDLEVMYRYINELSREDTFLSVLGKSISKAEEKEFLTMTLNNMKRGITRHFAVFVNGIYAGNCEIEKRKEHRVAHIGLVGMSLAKPYREEGIGSELFTLLISQGKEMKLRILQLSCFENNPRALHVYEKMGFKKVGLLPQAFAYKGSYVGEVIMYLPLDS